MMNLFAKLFRRQPAEVDLQAALESLETRAMVVIDESIKRLDAAKAEWRKAGGATSGSGGIPPHFNQRWRR